MGCVYLLLNHCGLKIDLVGLNFIGFWMTWVVKWVVVDRNLNDMGCEIGCGGPESYGPCRPRLLYINLAMSSST
jgi:hypothetical protein